MFFFWQTEDKLKSIGIREVWQDFLHGTPNQPGKWYKNSRTPRKQPGNFCFGVVNQWGKRSRFWVNCQCLCQHSNPEFYNIICGEPNWPSILRFSQAFVPPVFGLLQTVTQQNNSGNIMEFIPGGRRVAGCCGSGATRHPMCFFLFIWQYHISYMIMYA